MLENFFIINQSQFGYNNATYYYCKYLRDKYIISYLCWDHGLPKIEMDGVQVVYVNRKGNALLRTLRFLRQALKEIDNSKGIVFIKYFKGVSLLLRLLRPKHCFVLDIRTGSVHHHPMVRRFEDARLKFETLFFKNVTVISESLAEKLGLAKKAHILPLGADVISDSVKRFDEGLHLLYVGTLFNRNIDVTIQGFKQFYDEFKESVALSYTIIGSGPNNEDQLLKEMVAEYGLSEVVNVTGEIPHDRLTSWFDKANVGVSYVPMTDYYDCQPVTKTFEYLLSGMPVVATATSENKKVVDHSNGVLAGDTVEEFYSSLKRLYEKQQQFNSVQIRTKALCYSWENIVRKNLHTYLSKVDET